ncbi:MAG: excinuclease ABC subunit UvrC, partial [Oscillospiraceae bacterium]|nr:excinuclease ABC subunit UvrC [Oscillospiraceae bacterium]
DGKPLKKDYKRFKIEGLSDQDDYASMRQTLRRRFMHYLQGDSGFSEMPDALLIDGGVEHASAVLEELTELGVKVPIFGMVKDNRHRTRALVTPTGEEISLTAVPAVFALIGTIQEETHRFAIAYHHLLRSRRMRESELEKIEGIGPKRRALLLKKFPSVTAISKASLEELSAVLPEAAARAVYDHFHSGKEDAT